MKLDALILLKVMDSRNTPDSEMLLRTAAAIQAMMDFERTVGNGYSRDAFTEIDRHMKTLRDILR